MGSGSSPGEAHPPESESKALGWRHKSLVCWWSQSKGPWHHIRKYHKKIKENGKEGGGKEEEDSSFPNRIGGVLLPWPTHP